MIENILYYLDKENLQSPATKEQIEITQEKMGILLPAEYVDFLLKSNGYEGSIGESYVAIWNIEELITLNDAYEVKEFAPHLILIGSDGGGEAYGFDTRSKEFPIINTQFIGMGMEDEIVLGHSFNEFIETLYNG